MGFNKYINEAEDLVTPREETRAGFIAFALEKNRRSTPFIEEAKVFKQIGLPPIFVPSTELVEEAS